MKILHKILSTNVWFSTNMQFWFLCIHGSPGRSTPTTAQDVKHAKFQFIISIQTPHFLKKNKKSGQHPLFSDNVKLYGFVPIGWKHNLCNFLLQTRLECWYEWYYIKFPHICQQRAPNFPFVILSESIFIFLLIKTEI